jgi:microcystin-dependent protein
MPATLTADGITFSNSTITTTDLSPVGTIICCCFTTATYTPPEYLYCNGQAVSRTTYSVLFGRIGTTFGVGDGSTTFNVPNLRGNFICGWDDARGVDSGRTFGTEQSSSIGTHGHNTSIQGANHYHQGVTGGVSTYHYHNYSVGNSSNRPLNPGGGGTGNQGRYAANTGGISANHQHYLVTGGVSAAHAHVAGNVSGIGESRPRNYALAYFIKF